MKNEQKQFDEKQVDWYEVDQEGEKTISLRDRLLMHRVLIRRTIGAIIVIGLVVWLLMFVISLFFSSSGNDIEQNTRLYIESCQTADDVDECIASAAPRLAQQTGDIAYCDELEGNDYDSCAALSALTSLDIDDCKRIEDQKTKDDCNDAIVTQTMSGDYAYSDCEEYSSSEKVDNCHALWAQNASIDGNCDNEIISDAQCKYGAIIAEAIEAQDPTQCYLVGIREYKYTCLEMVGPGDKDFDGLDADEERYQGTSDENSDSDDDGLSDYEEVREHGTDPTNPDTDGDGYEDGTEVIGGYDPLG